jgi:hypothetical protein
MATFKATFDSIRQFFWPREAQKKAQMKKNYKTITLFTVSTIVLMKFGRSLADLIYNQNQLEEMIKAGFN